MWRKYVYYGCIYMICSVTCVYCELRVYVYGVQMCVVCDVGEGYIVRMFCRVRMCVKFMCVGIDEGCMVCSM